ncbi:acetyltransferase [Dyella silvatica]|uniref:acetyltransferase n=1 Tax=Dyella silvatica TaxID=2992128 RepID=UPI00225500EA|nr:acetyltransferase [Dyella silvatica]
MPIRKRVEADNANLAEVWRRSVTATHTFLTDADIQELYPQVRDVYLRRVEVWVCVTVEGDIAGFIGMGGSHVEMLFVEPARRGRSVGTRLLDHVKSMHQTLTVDVNEQNPQAHGFYRRYGFNDVGRSDTDAAGRPFPLIHMAL